MLLRARGATLLSHAVCGLLDSARVERVVIACPQRTHAACAAELEPDGHRSVVLVPGSEDRIASARLALQAAAPAGDAVVLVHDATRPFTPASTIRTVVEAVLAGADAVVPVEPVTDTVKVVDDRGVVRHTTDRDGLRRAQFPRGFRAAALEGVDIVDALELRGLDGKAVRAVSGHPHGMRVTTAFELAVAEALLADSDADSATDPVAIGESVTEGPP